MCFKRCNQLKNSGTVVGFLSQSFDPFLVNDVERHAFQNEGEIPDQPGEVVIATALVNIQAAEGTLFTARAMCVTGSQANISSDEFLCSPASKT